MLGGLGLILCLGGGTLLSRCVRLRTRTGERAGQTEVQRVKRGEEVESAKSMQ